MTSARRWYADLLIFWLNPCLNYLPIPQQRRWYPLTDAWPLYAQYIKKAIQSRSCFSNLLVFDAVTRTMNEGHTVGVIELDFAQAFDSVNHRFLLAKMKSFGVGDVVVHSQPLDVNRA